MFVAFDIPAAAPERTPARPSILERVGRRLKPAP
jgi:hypothetical protein